MAHELLLILVFLVFIKHAEANLKTRQHHEWTNFLMGLGAEAYYCQ